MGCSNIKYIIIIFKADLKSSKRSKFLHPMKFSYKEFNENDKLKFEDNLIYFLS
jgi:hypothetical protein